MKQTEVAKPDVALILSGVQTDFAAVEKRATQLQIVDPESYATFGETILIVQQLQRRLEEEEKQLRSPLNQALRELSGKFSPVKERLQAFRSGLEVKASLYLKKKREEEEKIKCLEEKHLREQQEKQRLAMEQGREAPKVKALPAKVLNFEAQERKVHTASGSVSPRTNIKWRVISLNQIPEAFTQRIPDKMKLDELARQMKDSGLLNEVAGIEFYSEDSFVPRHT
ncbi:MAG: hypothetical protein ABI623_09410 [bacterium]